MAKLDTLLIIRETGIVPVFYHKDVEIAKKALLACYEGGVRAFEFTNRGDFAHEVFAELSKYAKAELPGLVLGAGSIVDPATAALYIQLGATFIVGPCFNPEVATLCNRRGIPYSPGCATPTEIGMAQEAGCELVKVFPGDVLGPAFVKDVLGPMPWSSIMVTGGVSPDKENLEKWFRAGVTAVGMGGKLFPKNALASGDWATISALARNSIETVKTLR